MKHVACVSYLLAALIGFYWSIWMTLTGLYGMPFSWWYAELFAGSLLLVTGALLTWFSKRKWARWLPLLGSGMLAAFFVPALWLALPAGRADLVRVLDVVIVAISLILAAFRFRNAPPGGHNNPLRAETQPGVLGPNR